MICKNMCMRCAYMMWGMKERHQVTAKDMRNQLDKGVDGVLLILLLHNTRGSLGCSSLLAV